MRNKAPFWGLAAVLGVGATLGLNEYAQRAQALPQAGTFRVTVRDLVSDSSTQVKQITIEKGGPGRLQVDADVSHSGFALTNVTFVPRPDSRGTSVAELVFVADVIPTQPRGHNTVRLAAQASSGGSVVYGSVTWPVAGAAKAAGPLLDAVKPGVYPLGTRLQLGPFGGRPITLTVSEGGR